VAGVKECTARVLVADPPGTADVWVQCTLKAHGVETPHEANGVRWDDTGKHR
jgi:hypothetical protein